MADRNVELLEQSSELVASCGEELVDVLYTNLFADFPGVVPLFEDVDLNSQKTKLFGVLKLAVENLRRPEVLGPALQETGGRHVEYGAQEGHYPAAGATGFANARDAPATARGRGRVT